MSGKLKIQPSIENRKSKIEKLVVLGAGESGVGTAILATQKGYDVFVSDSGTITKKHREVLLHNEIRFEERKHTKEDILDADIAMKSPGIPDKVSIVQGL
ncbi:MAG TPA: UDP-N-acetylmuramoyl-L-alanine--D-glutamate ligase, partial [Flavobacteriia bacterium]|nr:UDP-N-acetylmuramoyl-L-alanine--D-glutamate ligase [Flavobacteriia bacterium]